MKINSMTKMLGVAVALVMMGGMAACDKSKAELDSTRRQLQTMTMERDSLKGQLEDSKRRAAVLQQQVGEIQAKLSAAATALVAPAGGEVAKGDKAEKKGASAGKAANAKPLNPAQTPAP